MPNPFSMSIGPFDRGRLTHMKCEKCGHSGEPKVSYGEAKTVYSACDLHYPERIRLNCARCNHEEWMRPVDYRPPTPEQIEKDEAQIREGGRIMRGLGMAFVGIVLVMIVCSILF